MFLGLAACTIGVATAVNYNNEFVFEEKLEEKSESLDEIIKFCSPFDVLFLDEILCAVSLNLLNEDKLMSFLEHKPRGLEIIMTGQTCQTGSSVLPIM